jgi:hypothetical protein
MLKAYYRSSRLSSAGAARKPGNIDEVRGALLDRESDNKQFRDFWSRND